MEMIPAMKPFPGWSFSSQYSSLDVLVNTPGTSTSSALADSSHDKMAWCMCIVEITSLQQSAALCIYYTRFPNIIFRAVILSCGNLIKQQ